MASSQIASEYIETLTADQSTRQLATEYVEVLAVGQRSSQLATMYIEIITPAVLLPPPAFIGWGRSL